MGLSLLTIFVIEKEGKKYILNAMIDDIYRIFDKVMQSFYKIIERLDKIFRNIHKTYKEIYLYTNTNANSNISEYYNVIKPTLILLKVLNNLFLHFHI